MRISNPSFCSKCPNNIALSFFQAIWLCMSSYICECSFNRNAVEHDTHRIYMEPKVNWSNHHKKKTSWWAGRQLTIDDDGWNDDTIPFHALEPKLKRKSILTIGLSPDASCGWNARSQPVFVYRECFFCVLDLGNVRWYDCLWAHCASFTICTFIGYAISFTYGCWE